MKFTIEAKTLLQAINNVYGVVEKRNTIPILSHIKLSVSNNQLQLTGTNLDMMATATCDVEQINEGQCTTNADQIKELATKLKAGSIMSVTLENEYLIVKSGNAAKVRLHTFNANDFPVMTVNNFTTSITLQASELKKALQATRFAISSEEVRYYLNGVYLHNADGVVKLVATDGHRLSLYETKHTDVIPSVIIPRQAVNELVKHEGGDVALHISPSNSQFEFEGLTIATKNIEGTYPDYTRVLPRHNTAKATVESSEAKYAVGLVGTVQDGVNKSRGVKLSFRDGELEFSVRDEASEIIAANRDGHDLDIGVSSRYLVDALDQAESGDVDIIYGSDNDPIMFKYGDKPELTIVTMPMRV